MENPNQYTSGTISNNGLSVVRFDPETGQHEWSQLKNEALKEKSVKHVRTPAKPETD